MNIDQELKTIISERLGVPTESIEAHSHFSEDFNADPMSVAELFSTVQEKFEITIPADEMVTIKTVADLSEAINENLNT